MKKLLLFISLFIFGNTIGQTLTVINNTSNTIDFDFWAMDNATCIASATQSVFPSLGPLSTAGPYTLPTGDTEWVSAYGTSGGVSHTVLVTSMSSCMPNPNLSAACGFPSTCTVTWTEDPMTRDVVVEFF
jgi:hypothetical protein